MHGLHVIKFNNKDRSGSSEEIEKKSESVSRRFSSKDKLVSQKRQIHVGSDNKKYPKLLVHTSLSRILGPPTYDISKNKISRHLWSRKRKVSSNRILCIDGNETHKKSKHDIKQKLKFRRKHFLSQREPVNDNIQILFKCKNWKSKTRRPLTLQSKDINKYAFHYNSKSSYDLCERNKNNKFCCRLHIPQVKLHRKKTYNLQTEVGLCGHKHCRPFYSDHVIIQSNKSNAKITNNCHHHAHKLAGTYNVIDFPNEVGTIVRDSPPILCDRRRITVTTSCIDNSKCCGDNAVFPKPCNLNPSKLHSRSLTVCPKNRKSFRLSKHPACPIFITKTLKITLFGLSVIIWFPCILIISLLWVISYPTRPREIIKTVKDIESCGTQLCHKDDQDFWYSIYNFVADAVKKLLRLYEAMFSLIKKKNVKRKCTRFIASRRNRDKEYPNPKKKYQLFFDNDRGWVMKPSKIRKDTRPKKNANDLKVNSIKYENEAGIFAKNLIEISQTTTKEQERQDLKQQINPRESVQKIKKEKTLNTSREIQIEYKSQVSNCNGASMKDASVDVNCMCEPVQNQQTEYKNLPVYSSSLQKSHKFVTFDDRIPPHSRCDLCTVPVLETLCSSPFQTKNNLIESSSKPIPLRRRPCNCSLAKSKECHRKYAIPRSFYDQYQSKINSGSRKTKRKNVCKKPKVVCINNFVKFCQRYQKRTARIIKAADSSVWNCNKCEDTFVQTLRKRPWAWVHRRWPTFYPYFLIFCKFYENVAYAMLYICTACIWCPVFCLCYLGCNLFCRCVL